MKQLYVRNCSLSSIERRQLAHFFFLCKARLYFHIVRQRNDLALYTGHDTTLQFLTLALGALVTIDVQCLLTQTLHLVTSAVLVNIQVGHPLRILAVLYVDFRDLSCLPDPFDGVNWADP